MLENPFVGLDKGAMIDDVSVGEVLAEVMVTTLHRASSELDKPKDVPRHRWKVVVSNNEEEDVLVVTGTMAKGSSTSHRGQMVYHYHKDRMTRLDHCTITPKATSLWNVELTSVCMMLNDQLLSKEFS
ncbi:hypothetical protein VNO78_22084 [Psophocarpus tetragonolobus]|uniref:Uncharacterized protein n=1 Tax=Psophocarpus tetragonolobus TaxID=3891 RepID=A0AAN9SD68_PSOTE